MAEFEEFVLFSPTIERNGEVGGDGAGHDKKDPSLGVEMSPAQRRRKVAPPAFKLISSYSPIINATF